MTYIDGWFHGNHVTVEDWYKDGLVYANVKQYWKSTCTSRPDREKDFLLRIDRNRINHYPASIAEMLVNLEERRDGDGRLVPITIKLPEIDLLTIHA
ncbi:MAG: hypothetical protein IJH79_20855 [Lentisphaeria bacterium]|nr:hypothetical protein [Lentisphaeria bacterium]